MTSASAPWSALWVCYGLSLASAFWIGQRGPLDQVWSTCLGAAVCVGLGIVTGWRAGVALVAGALMLSLVVIAYAAGSSAYAWAAPFPADVMTLFLLGGRTPLVIGPAVLIGAVGVWRVVTHRREA